MSEVKSKYEKPEYTDVLKYDIYTLENAVGSGKSRRYVRLLQHEPKNADQVKEAIQKRSPITKGATSGVLTELRDLMIEELRNGRRFYIPEIGYFSLSAGLETDGEDGRVNGDDVCITGVKFRPEASLLADIRHNLHFSRAHFKKSSTQFDEEEILAKIKDYVQENGYVTVSFMSRQLNMTKYVMRKWFTHFCEEGILVKGGTDRSPVYMLKK